MGKRSRSPVSPRRAPRRREATPRRTGPCGDPPQRESPRLGLEFPRGLLRSRLGPLCRRPPFSEAPKIPKQPGDPRPPTPRIPELENLGPRGWTGGLPSSPGEGPEGSLTRGGRGGCSGARGARGSPKVEGHVAGAGDQSAAPATLGALGFSVPPGNCLRSREFRLFSGLA